MRMKNRDLALIGALNILVANIAIVPAAEPPLIRWNEAAQSHLLNKDELVKVGASFPAWKIKQITWPSRTEISSASVMVDDKVKAWCIYWLQKFIKREHLPKDLDKHLIAMNNWGLIMKQSYQKRLCDVFITRFKKDPYVIHIQESPCDVVIGVADERLPKDPNVNHTSLVTETATSILNDKLKPDANADLYLSHIVRGQSKISRLWWMTQGVATTDKHGRKCANIGIAGKNGATHVQAETDGRFVKFAIEKCLGGARAYPDPHMERFGPSE